MSNKNKYPKVLLATPTSDHKDYCMLDWISHVKKLTYPNFDVIIVDNSTDEKYYKKIQEALGDKGKVFHKNRKKGQRLQDLMRDCNNKIRTEFLKNEEYKALISLESDLFPPVNFIEYLLRQRKPFVGIPYFTGQHYNSYIVEHFAEHFGNLRQIKPSLMKSFLKFDGKLAISNNTGIGCTFIDRKIMEDIKFRTEKGDTGFPDTFFHLDIYQKWGMQPYLTTDVISEHRNSDWRKINKIETQTK